MATSKKRPGDSGQGAIWHQLSDPGIRLPYAVEDIHIVREGNVYRLLHGQLRLLTALGLQREIFVEVRGEGHVKLVRTPQGYFGGPDWQRLPVLLC